MNTRSWMHPNFKIFYFTYWANSKNTTRNERLFCKLCTVRWFRYENRVHSTQTRDKYTFVASNFYYYRFSRPTRKITHTDSGVVPSQTMHTWSSSATVCCFFFAYFFIKYISLSLCALSMVQFRWDFVVDATWTVVWWLSPQVKCFTARFFFHLFFRCRHCCFGLL